MHATIAITISRWTTWQVGHPTLSTSYLKEIAHFEPSNTETETLAHKSASNLQDWLFNNKALRRPNEAVNS